MGFRCRSHPANGARSLGRTAPQDHAFPLRYRHAPGLIRLGKTVRQRRHLSARVPAHQARHGPHVPDHERVHRSVAHRESALAIVGTDRRKWIWNRSLASFPDIRAQALASLEAVGLKERADEPVKLFSYGERRQLVAGALSTQPRVLFLDEPCAGLSPSERQRIFNMIRALPREITLVDDRTRHGRGAWLGRPRHGNEPRAGDGGRNTRRNAKQSRSSQRVFWPCLARPCPSPCSRFPRSTPITGTATSCRGKLYAEQGADRRHPRPQRHGKTTLIRSVADLRRRAAATSCIGTDRCAANRPTPLRRPVLRSCRRADESSARSACARTCCCPPACGAIARAYERQRVGTALGLRRGDEGVSPARRADQSSGRPAQRRRAANAGDRSRADGQSRPDPDGRASEGLSPRLVLQCRTSCGGCGPAVTPSCWSSKTSSWRSRSPTRFTCSRPGNLFSRHPAELAKETQILDQHLGVSGAKMI